MSNAESEVSKLKAEVARLQSLLDSFWSGDIPQFATLDHMVLAKAGRHRLIERSKQPALLVKK